MLNNRIQAFVLLVLLPMIIGFFTYYFFSPDVWFVKNIDILLGISNHRCIDCSGNFGLMFIRFYFLDMIWAFAMTNTLALFMGNNAKYPVVYALIPIALGSLLETLQYLNVVQGTCDVWDVIAEGGAAIVGLLIIKNLGGLTKNEKV